MEIGIYKWTSPSGKSYIGQAINLKKRWREFRRPSNIYYTSKGSAIDNARAKYPDYDNQWQYEILEYCKEEELDEKETYYIDYYDTFHNGYNATRGGDGTKGRKMEDWQKELCSKVAKERWEQGFNHSWLSTEEGAEWLRNHQQYERTDDIRNSISLSLKEYYKDNSSARAKKCKVYDKDGNFIAEYDSISQAAKAHNCDQGQVSRAIKRNRLVKGLLFSKE
jgi:group I intron endonuclease